MKPNYCKSAGQARDCMTCKHNPANQLNESKGTPISPAIKRDGRCPYYVGYIKPRTNA